MINALMLWLTGVYAFISPISKVNQLILEFSPVSNNLVSKRRHFAVSMHQFKPEEGELI